MDVHWVLNNLNQEWYDRLSFFRIILKLIHIPLMIDKAHDDLIDNHKAHDQPPSET